MADAESQFEALRQVVHLTSKDDYFAVMLAEPEPLGLGDRVRFDHSTGMWHVWNGFLWLPDRTTKVYDLIRDKVHSWLSSTTINPSESSAKVYITLMDTAKKASVLKALASMPSIAMTGEEWDLNPELVGFTNGTLDLRTLVLDPNPDPALLISRTTNVAWDPNADMQPFLDFVEDITSKDSDVGAYLLSVLGYSMIGTNKEQKFWMWVGGGSNGKGILARTVAKALHDYAATPPDALYMRSKNGAVGADKPRPELLKLQGARFVFMSEPQGGQFNEELLKAHSGNDPIEARTLYSKTFKTFQPTHTIVFLTNNPPRTEDVGPSMQRRVRLIRFNEDYRGSKGDKELEDRLQSVANLQGALRVMASWAKGYLLNGMVEPQAVTDWSAAYISENDPIQAFVDEMCIADPKSELAAGQAFAAFEGYCERDGVDKLTKTGFGLAMTLKYVKKVKTAGSFYLGLRLKNMSDVTDDDE